LVSGLGLLRPLLVWRGYWIDGDSEMSKETGGQAFPMLGNVGYNSEWQLEEGMTLRDYFASMVMSGVQSGPNLNKWDPTEYAEYSYEVADAMLKARNQ
jgi:hypothetical protein